MAFVLAPDAATMTFHLNGFGATAGLRHAVPTASSEASVTRRDPLALDPRAIWAMDARRLAEDRGRARSSWEHRRAARTTICSSGLQGMGSQSSDLDILESNLVVTMGENAGGRQRAWYRGMEVGWS